MNAARDVGRRLLALLEADTVLLRVVNGVYDRPSPRTALPLIAIGAVVRIDWGTKDRAGCELRIELRHAAVVQDDGTVAARIDAVVAALRGPIETAEIISARLIRSRSEYDKHGHWTQLFELRVRCLQI